jgi:hypothetical protein
MRRCSRQRLLATRSPRDADTEAAGMVAAHSAGKGTLGLRAPDLGRDARKKARATIRSTGPLAYAKDQPTGLHCPSVAVAEDGERLCERGELQMPWEQTKPGEQESLQNLDA